MIWKTFRGGLTFRGAVSTIDYLLNERVDSGEAIIIDGSKQITQALIKEASKKFKWSWSSGVLSFSETISEEEAKEIIRLHKEVTFAGMKHDQYNILYVLHVDKGRSEIHYIAPRMELSSGKSLNPYIVSRDFRKKDLFQDYINSMYKFSSPKEVKRHKPTVKKKLWQSKQIMQWR